jgi:putative SOS response-associated peptidase YedK
MCGRFFRDVSWATLREWYDLFSVTAPNLEPRYNIAPTQDIVIIGKARVKGGGTRREMRWAHWGLVPSWAKDTKLASNMINARAETVAEKPAYRAAFKRRRCLIPADGFFEWIKTEEGKQPFNIHHTDGHPMTFAGLWEENEELGIRSCTILTSAANDYMRPMHHRMPVLLNQNQFELWLDHDGDKDQVQELIRPYKGNDLEAYPVSKAVNSVRNDDPSNLDRWGQADLL